MGKAARDHLLDTLRDLDEEQLKQFKAKLNEIPLREGFANIPRGKLQEATRLDLSDLLLSYDADAVQVAAQVMESVHLERLAEKLRAAPGIDAGMTLEEPSRVTQFHAVLDNPEFSLLGVLLIPILRFIPVHFVVLLYKTIRRTTTLHLYLVPNDSSVTQELEFHKTPTQLQSFVDVYLGNRDGVNLSVKKKEGLFSVWAAWLESEDVLIQEECRASVKETKGKKEGVLIQEECRASVKETKGKKEDVLTQEECRASVKETKGKKGTLEPRLEKPSFIQKKTVRDHLVDILENLLVEELRRFTAKLNEIPLQEGFANIPRGKLQAATPLDLSDLLLSYYTDAYAVQVAAQVLESIHLKRQAEKLWAATGIGTQVTTLIGASLRRAAPGTADPEDNHSGGSLGSAVCRCSECVFVSPSSTQYC